MPNKPIPPVGLVVACSETDLGFRNSNTPCLRIVFAHGHWQVSPTKERGLLVYITQPAKIALSAVKAVRLTEVNAYVAKAEIADV